MCMITKVNSYSWLLTNSSLHVFGSVLIGPLHVQTSDTHHPLPEAILHSCYVIQLTKVDLFNTVKCGVILELCILGTVPA